MSTEGRNSRSFSLDRMSAAEIVRLMTEEETAVIRAVRDQTDAIAYAAERVAGVLAKQGRVVYVGSGTSGRIAVMDAAEMPPTFGIDPDRFVAIVSGGELAAARAQENAEDDEHAAVVALNQHKVSRHDAVIGLAASGRTPFTVAALRHAKRKGAWTCAVVNNVKSPLEEVADHAIVLKTGPEVLTGSTRLKAGTAQKLVLNRISTTAMVLQGKVVENLMVDLKMTNAKLRDRGVRILRDLTHATEQEAIAALESTGWNLRAALVELGRL